MICMYIHMIYIYIGIHKCAYVCVLIVMYPCMFLVCVCMIVYGCMYACMYASTSTLMNVFAAPRSFVVAMKRLSIAKKTTGCSRKE